MTRPAYHVDVATAAAPIDIVQPPSGIQTTGFPAHSKFASAWANWLFYYNGQWARELDYSRLGAVDFLSAAVPQLMKGGGDGFSLSTGSGLTGLIPDAGGVYVILGRRVDLTDAALAVKYPTGFTLPANSVVYAHAREETNYGGASAGEILISTNASEVGYQAIWTGTTDATDLVSQTQLALEAFSIVQPFEMSTHLYIDNPEDEIALFVVGANTTLPTVFVQCTTGAACVQADIGNSAGFGFTSSSGNGDGTCFYAALSAGANPNASGFYVTADAASTGAPIRVTNASAVTGMLVAASGNGSAATFQSTGSASSAVSMSGGATQTLNLAGSGAGMALRAFGGSTAGADAISASTSNTSGSVYVASMPPAGTSAARCYEGTATGSGVAAEFIAANGYPLRLQATGSAPELKFSGRSTDSTDVFDGSVLWNNVERQLKVSDASDAAYRGIWTSLGGRAHGFDCNNTATTAGGVAWVAAATAVLEDSNAPKEAGRTAILRFTCNARSVIGGAANMLHVRLRRVTPSATTLVTRAGDTPGGANDGYYMPDTSTRWQRDVSLVFQTTITGSGDHTYVAEIQTGTANNIQVRDAALVVDGLY